MALLESWERGLLASAYELAEEHVEQDASWVQRWLGSDSDLTAELEARHGWSAASERGPYYLAAVRRALT